jgi:hypothetical protein
VAVLVLRWVVAMDFHQPAWDSQVAIAAMEASPAIILRAEADQAQESVWFILKPCYQTMTLNIWVVMFPKP